MLYVEVTAENLQYLAKATLAQHKANQESGGQSAESPIEDSNIGESAIDAPPVLESQSASGSAADMQEPAKSVLAMLCKN